MQGMVSASLAKFCQFKTVGVIPLVLLGCVVTLFALGALEVNNHPYVFFRHDSLIY